jgi:hypothetical protein
MEESNTFMENNDLIPHMKSLALVTNKMVLDCYVIETTDGLKGTLVDAYGPYADRKLSEFMQQVESFQKKTAK